MIISDPGGELEHLPVRFPTLHSSSMTPFYKQPVRTCENYSNGSGETRLTIVIAHAFESELELRKACVLNW